MILCICDKKIRHRCFEAMGWIFLRKNTGIREMPCERERGKERKGEGEEGEKKEGGGRGETGK